MQLNLPVDSFCRRWEPLSSMKWLAIVAPVLSLVADPSFSKARSCYYQIEHSWNIFFREIFWAFFRGVPSDSLDFLIIWEFGVNTNKLPEIYWTFMNTPWTCDYILQNLTSILTFGKIVLAFAKNGAQVLWPMKMFWNDVRIIMQSFIIVQIVF